MHDGDFFRARGYFGQRRTIHLLYKWYLSMFQLTWATLYEYVQWKQTSLLSANVCFAEEKQLQERAKIVKKRHCCLPFYKIYHYISGGLTLYSGMNILPRHTGTVLGFDIRFAWLVEITFVLIQQCSK